MVIEKFEATELTWCSVVFRWKLDEPAVVVLSETASDGKRYQCHYRGYKRYVKVVGLPANTRHTFHLSTLDTGYHGNHGNGRREIQFRTLKCGKHDIKLITAIQDHNLPQVKEICSSAPEMINIPDRTGVSPIMHAAQRGYPSIIRILELAGGNVNYANPGGKTALMLAAYQGNSHVISTLMDLGCDWSKHDNAGCTALHYSIDRGDIEICSDLIQHGADVNLRDSRGYTGLHSLCLSDREDVEMGRFLLEHKSDPDETFPSGETPLMAAARTGKPDLVQLLIEYGANPQSKTRFGYTALDMCTEGSACQDILLELQPSESECD